MEMFMQKKSIWILGFITLLSNASHASESSKARVIIEQLIKNKSIPGLSVTVSVAGETKWSEAFGFADLENSIKLTPNSLMRIGSISKPLTTAAIVRAMDTGVVDIEANVLDILPDYPQRAPISLRQLGGHLSGIRSYLTEREHVIYEHYDSVLESLELFQNDELISAPGAEFLYTSYGFSLLSAVVSTRTQLAFSDFMEINLWQPLDMKSTALDDLSRVVANRARQYEIGMNGEFINAPFMDDSYKLAGSGMLSSSEDLTKFGGMLLSGPFISHASRSLLFTSQKTSSGVPTGYGFGWFVDMNKFLDDRADRVPPELMAHLKGLYQDRQLIWHSGTASGASAMLLMVPETEVVIAIIANLGGVGREVIATAMEIEAIYSEEGLQ